MNSQLLYTSKCTQRRSCKKKKKEVAASETENSYLVTTYPDLTKTQGSSLKAVVLPDEATRYVV